MEVVEQLALAQEAQSADGVMAALAALKRLEDIAGRLEAKKETATEEDNGVQDAQSLDTRESLLAEVEVLRQHLNDVRTLVQTTEVSAANLAGDFAALSEERDVLQRRNEEMRIQLSTLGIEGGGDLEALITHLQDQVTRGESDRRRMRLELEELRAWKGIEGKSEDEVKLQAVKAETTLARLKESFVAVKADKKRLKAEKTDLLQQMKQLYAALQEKEADVKDFVSTYEARMQEFEESVHQLQAEKEESEREKWEILRRARDSAERSVSLRTQLDIKETALQAAEDELARLRRQVDDGVRSTPVGKPLPNGSATTPVKLHRDATTPTHLQGSSSDAEGMPPYSDGWRGKSASISVTGGDHLSPHGLRPYGRVNHRSSEPDLSGCGFVDSKELRKSKRRKFGSLSKVFTRPGRLSGKHFDELSDGKWTCRYRDSRIRASTQNNCRPGSPCHL